MSKKLVKKIHCLFKHFSMSVHILYGKYFDDKTKKIAKYHKNCNNDGRFIF